MKIYIAYYINTIYLEELKLKSQVSLDSFIKGIYYLERGNKNSNQELRIRRGIFKITFTGVKYEIMNSA